MYQLKSSVKFLVFLSLILCYNSLYAQGTIIPLKQEGWVGGLSGFVGWDNYSAKASNTHRNIDSDTEGFGFVISSRNGRFVQDNLAFGFDFLWEEKHLTTTRYDLEPLDIYPTEVYRKDRLGFIGFWLRYYIPFIGTGWAIYPEASVGYGAFKTTEEPTPFPGTGEVTRKADGLVYNLGFGGTIFVSNNVAFETTVRYQGGNLTGEYEIDSEKLDNLEVKLSNVDILFGIMVYLR